MKQSVVALICMACLFAAGNRCSGQERASKALDQWPSWRGPLANGVAPNGQPPLRWDAKTSIRWKTPIPGKSSATPIVWNDDVFILTAVDTGRAADPRKLPKTDPKFVKKTKAPKTFHRYAVYCLDRKTGKVRWHKTATEQVPHEGHHYTHSFAGASPTTNGKHLYVSFGSRGIFCFDLNGQLIWQRDLGDMNTRYGWGEATSPVLHKDALVVNWDHEGPSFISVLDARTGKTRWTRKRDERTSWATPLLVDHKGQTQVIVNGTNLIRSYDLANGKIIWECSGMTLNAIPSPLLKDNFAYCMSGYRGSAAAAISLDAKGDVSKGPQVAWRFGRGTPYVPSPILVGDRLYFTARNTSVLTCLNIKTGKPIFEAGRLPNVRSLYASPVSANDRIYFTGRDGTTVVIKASDKVEVLSVNRLNEPVDASPAIVGKQLFLRGEKHVYCIEE